MASYQGAVKQQHFLGAGMVATLMGLLTFVLQFGTSSTPSNTSGYAPQSNSVVDPNHLAYYENAIMSLFNQNNNTHPYGAMAPNGAMATGHGYSTGAVPQTGYGQAGYGPLSGYGQPAGYQSVAATPVSYGQQYQAGGVNGNVYNRPASNDMEVHFSPNGNATQVVLREMEAAREQIMIHTGTLSSTPIVQALVKAVGQRKKVFVVMDVDEAMDASSAASYLASQGVSVLVDRNEDVHNNVILIDQRVVITGSFQFSNVSDTQHAGNLMVIRDRPEVFSAYQKDLQRHFQHSQPFTAGLGNGAASANRRLSQPGQSFR